MRHNLLAVIDAKERLYPIQENRRSSSVSMRDTPSLAFAVTNPVALWLIRSWQAEPPVPLPRRKAFLPG